MSMTHLAVLVLPYLICGFIGYCLRKQRSALNDLQYRLTQSETIQDEMKALLNADITFGRALQQLKNQIGHLDSELGALKNQQPHDTAYQQSLALLELGGDPDAMTESKLLNKAEAELIKNLHAYRKKRKQLIAGNIEITE